MDTTPHFTTGSGKTNALELRIATLRADGSQVWLADPSQRRQDLADHVDRHGAGPEAALDMLRAAVAMIEQRQEATAAGNGQDDLDTVRVLVDDLPAMLSPETADLLMRILRTGRKNKTEAEVLAESGVDPFPGHPALRTAFSRPRYSLIPERQAPTVEELGR